MKSHFYFYEKSFFENILLRISRERRL